MKLQQLYKLSENDILRKYLKSLRNLCESRKYRRLLNEAKITITIDDVGGNNIKPEIGITQDAKMEFVEKAKELGEFENEEWLNGLIKSMEQAGVQGFKEICEDEKPVTNKQMRQLISLLVNLISK